MDFTALKTAITNAIKQNGNEEITGDVLQQILLSMVGSLGDSAINQLVTQNTMLHSALSQEASYRLSKDNQLQAQINGVAADFDNILEQLRQLIRGYEPIIIHGDVTNAPDEEDLTSNAQHLLQFKNNAYNPIIFSGMGKVFLRKNLRPLSTSYDFDGFVEGVTTQAELSGTPDQIYWDRTNEYFVGLKDGVYYLAWTGDDVYVPTSESNLYMNDGNPYRWNGSEFYIDSEELPNIRNVLTQDMINEANTIYIIRYDYTLKENITIPAGCVLQFDGGSISGEHTITGTNTAIQAGLVKIFNTDVTIAGTWNVAEAYPEWFGAVGDGVTDDTLAVQKVCKSFLTINIKNKYKCSESIDIIKDYTTVKGKGIIYFTSSLEISGKNCDNLIFKDFSVVSLSGYSGVGAWFGNEAYLTNINPNTKINYNNILIDNVKVDNYTSGYHEMIYGSHGIFVRTGAGASICDITIQNCISRGAGASPNALNDLDGSDNIYIASYSSHSAPMERVKILNNYCEYAGRQNLSLASDNKNCIVGAVISGNTFKDSTMGGVDLEYASEVTFANNVFVNSGKYTGYYDPADSVRHNNYMLQSAIATQRGETYAIVGCNFITCRNACGKGANFIGCHFINTPLIQADSADYNFKCVDSEVEFNDANIEISIRTYLNETVFINCNINLGNSYMQIGNKLIMDGCNMQGNREGALVECRSTDNFIFVNSTISCPNGIPFQQDANAPSIFVDKCSISCKNLVAAKGNTREYNIINSKLVVDTFLAPYFANNTEFTFVLMNNTIEVASPVIFGIGTQVTIQNNYFKFSDTLKQVSDVPTTVLFFFWSSRDIPTKVILKDNYIKNVPDNVTILLKERGAGTGYNVNIYNVSGNVLLGNEVQERTITQQAGRKSTTAASLIERNSFNGVDLTL